MVAVPRWTEHVCSCAVVQLLYYAPGLPSVISVLLWDSTEINLSEEFIYILMITQSAYLHYVLCFVIAVHDPKIPIANL